MKKFFGVIFHPVVLASLALILLAALIWWIGPMVAIGRWTPLESELARALLIGFILLLVVLRWAYARWRARRASQHLTDGLMRSPAGKQDQPVSNEQQLLATRFKEAVASLKKMRLHAAGRKPGWRDWLSCRGDTISTNCPGTCSLARPVPARPPRWSTPG